MQWKDPELKDRPLTKADLGCVGRKEQTFSSNAEPLLLFDLKGWRRLGFHIEAQSEFWKRVNVGLASL